MGTYLDLDLIIYPAENLNGSIWHPAAQVAGAVHFRPTIVTKQPNVSQISKPAVFRHNIQSNIRTYPSLANGSGT